MEHVGAYSLVQVGPRDSSSQASLPTPPLRSLLLPPQVALSDVYAVGRRNLWFNREWSQTDIVYGLFMLAMHGLCLFAPATFSWGMVGLFLGTYFLTGCLGITLSFHRQLSHR